MAAAIVVILCMSSLAGKLFSGLARLQGVPGRNHFGGPSSGPFNY